MRATGSIRPPPSLGCGSSRDSWPLPSAPMPGPSAACRRAASRTPASPRASSAPGPSATGTECPRGSRCPPSAEPGARRAAPCPPRRRGVWRHGTGRTRSPPRRAESSRRDVGRPTACTLATLSHRITSASNCAVYLELSSAQGTCTVSTPCSGHRTRGTLQKGRVAPSVQVPPLPPPRVVARTSFAALGTPQPAPRRPLHADPKFLRLPRTLHPGNSPLWTQPAPRPASSSRPYLRPPAWVIGRDSDTHRNPNSLRRGKSS